MIFPLSPGEKEVVWLVSIGCTTEEAARRRGTSPYTVAKQLKSARLKLGAKNTAHAVAICLSKGIID